MQIYLKCETDTGRERHVRREKVSQGTDTNSEINRHERERNTWEKQTVYGMMEENKSQS